MEGIAPAPPLKPLALEELRQRYLAFVGHQRGVATKHIHFAHFARIGAILSSIPSRWTCWTSIEGIGEERRWARPRSIERWLH